MVINDVQFQMGTESPGETASSFMVQVLWMQFQQLRKINSYSSAKADARRLLSVGSMEGICVWKFFNTNTAECSTGSGDVSSRD